MQKWCFLTLSVCMLGACSPENRQFVQPAASAADAASETAQIASDVAMMASAASGSVVMASGASGTASGAASGATAASSVNAASAVAASGVSAQDAAALKTKKVPIGGSNEFGNTVYYFPASIKKEGKLFYVLTENRFDKPQKLPDSGKMFQYSLIKEAVDCQRKLTDPISVIHFSAQNQRVEAHEFPYPNYDEWSELELQALADEHPDSAFIAAVCQIAKGQ